MKPKNHKHYPLTFKDKRKVFQTRSGFRWAFTADTWMQERDNFEDFDLIENRVDGVYYTGSKSHPWYLLVMICSSTYNLFHIRVPESERVNEIWFEAPVDA